MKHLLDTNIVVDHLRRKKIIDEDILRSGGAISIITLGELLYGAYKSDNPSKSLASLKQTISLLNLDIVDLNNQTMVEFGLIKADLEKQGKRLEDFDLLIAATARINSLTLVTGNKRHFQRVKGLKVAD